MRYSLSEVELDVVEAGDPGDPAIVLLHGFPESSYSWRHQMRPLADAGYHVLAPDQRGYARSSAPSEVADYRVDHLTGDIVDLLAATGHDDAAIVGHDWGALVLWDLARLHPGKVRTAISASVPYINWPAPPTDLFRMLHGDNFFYMLYFQEVGPAERELGADVTRTLRTLLWAASGVGFPDVLPDSIPAAGHGFLDSLAQLGPPPAELPSWLTEADLATYVDQFTASGFFGPVSWYRNLDADHELVRDLPFPNIPTGFIGGTKDMVTARTPGMIESMDTTLPDHRRSVVLEGVGHWTQQEDPAAFNDALLGLLRDLDRAPAPSR